MDVDVEAESNALRDFHRVEPHPAVPRRRIIAVGLNTWREYHPNAPFGGSKASGCGREQGAGALETYAQYKTVWANLG